jgi:hypothetical protein
VVETYLLWKGCPHKLRHICEVVKGKWWHFIYWVEDGNRAKEFARVAFLNRRKNFFWMLENVILWMSRFSFKLSDYDILLFIKKKIVTSFSIKIKNSRISLINKSSPHNMVSEKFPINFPIFSIETPHGNELTI